MKLSQVLGSLQGNDGEKTAAVASPSSTPTQEKTAAETQTRLKAALAEVTAVTPATEKKASNTPVADLTKLAAETANAEHESLVKEAHLYGAAVADGFMARLGQYNDAAEKVASQQPAGVSPRLEKQAAELGFATTMGQMEKLAGAAYVKGYNETVEQIYKVAHTCFVGGYKNAAEMIVASR
jgi:hypothetical protein